MQRIIFTTILATLLFASCLQQKGKVNIGVSFDEPNAPLPLEPAQNWEQLKPGIHISWGSSYERYHKEYIPDTNTEEIVLTGWKGERLSAQMVAWAKDSIQDLTIEFEDLASSNGVIMSSSIRYYFVRNVISDKYFSCADAGSKDPDFTQLLPDCLVEVEAYNMREKSTRGIWFNIDIPADANPGEYKTSIEVWANKKKVKNLPLVVHVQNQLLPEPREWKIHLDLWQNPYAVARYYNVKLWSADHFEIMRPLYKKLAEAGQKCITTTIMHKPWGWVTYDYFESMVMHIKRADGSWEFDYSIFDQWVSFMMDLGIKKQINCYTMVPWVYEFAYYDEALGKDTSIVANPTSQAYADYWRPFLKSFKVHLQEKGWYDITAIAMDERPMAEMESALKLVEEYLGVKIASAANYSPEFAEKVHDLSVIIHHEVPKDLLQQRKRNGQLTTYYVCCVPEYPNNFTFSPPAEGVWQGWFACAKDFDGILRWAYNSWNEDPLHDTRNERWAAGDAFLVYPGLNSSIRFEKFREGLQDFEKLHIIIEQLRKLDTDEAKDKLARINDLLMEFEISQIERDGALPLIMKAKALMNEVSE